MALHTQGARPQTFPALRELTGNGRRPSRFERGENFRPSPSGGSHMPIDAGIHWSWRNPLNIIPASLALVTIMAVIELIASVF